MMGGFGIVILVGEEQVASVRERVYQNVHIPKVAVVFSWRASWQA
jgi:hypothetical protein